MRRDTTTVQGFILECFLYEGYVHTWECPGWKKPWKFNCGGVGLESECPGWKNFEKLISDGDVY